MTTEIDSIQVSLTFDVDAIAGWLGSYGGEDSPADLSRGENTGRVGIPRLLEFCERYDIKTSWFTPGHSIETFPDEMQAVADAGHEIQPHGYSHENPTSLSAQQEEAVLVKSMQLCEDLTGEKPVGYRAPWWEFSTNTLDLLQKHGMIYDSSLMGRDFESYFVRRGDNWHKIDYDEDAEHWMKPYEFGEETDLIEIPISWYRDDLPPLMFIKHPNYNYGYTHPATILDMFTAQFDYLYKRKGEGFIIFTFHPDVAGRSEIIMLLLEPLVEHIQGHDGVEFTTVEQIARTELSKRGVDG